MGISERLHAELLKKKKAAELTKNTLEDEVLSYRKQLNPETGRMELVWG